jgi:hypothetical protein
MFATADTMTAGIIFLVVIIGLLLMRRVKKGIIEPLVERQRPILYVRVTRGDPELPALNVRSLPFGPAQDELRTGPAQDGPVGDIVEGQCREL